MTSSSDRPLPELEREVEASRTRLELAMNDLGRQLTLDGLVASVSRNFTTGDVANSVDTLVEKAKNNPLPIALVGAGLGWLLLGDGGPSTRTIKRNARYGAQRVADGAEHMVDSAIHGAEHLADSARHGAEYAADSARYGAAQVAGAVRHGAHNVAEGARHGAERVADNARYGAHSVAEGARHGAERVADNARYGANKVASGVQQGTDSARSMVHSGGSSAGGAPSAIGPTGTTTGVTSTATVRHDIHGRPLEPGKEFDDHHDSITDRARRAWSDAEESMSNTAHNIGHAANEFAHDARYRMRETRAQSADMAHRARVQSAEMAHRAREEVVHAYRTNPVVLGLGVAAVASLIGVLIPNSRRENEYMGPYARDARHAVEDVANEALERAEEELEHVAEEADKYIAQAEVKADEAIREGEAAAGKAIDKASEKTEKLAEKAEEKIATAGKKDDKSPNTGSGPNNGGAKKEKATASS